MSFESIVKCKCPRCHEGDMFKANHPYKKEGTQMYEFCEVCGQPFELETGFYWGAMYISYAMTAGWAIIHMVLFYLIFGNQLLYYYLPFLVVTLILLNPLFFRLSRSAYLAMFVYYNPRWKENILPKIKKDIH